MVRASTRPDGVTAPVDSGRSSHERMNRTSSSRRMPFFCSNSRILFSIVCWSACKGIGPKRDGKIANL
jgi:hypothetical protein